MIGKISKKRYQVRASFLCLFLCSLPFQILPAHASDQPSVAEKNGASAVGIHELSSEIGARLKRVEEFRFIQEEAQRLGVRAWLFGGTAAGYAHYVKWDMQREKGDPRFQKDRFDYDYTNIYRSTQDLDIVIDGNAEQAQQLQNALAEKYPHLQGSKTAWEVRLLTQDMGDKLAILNNPDFLNQHTDSNSTGLIEITKPSAGEPIVRDARDWKSQDPYFLKDVHDGKLHFYFSPLHEATRFYKEGRNPPILSVIRYLTKAFQYELEIRPEDLARLKKIIEEFDPKGAQLNNEYVKKWIEKNGKKLIQNAVNIEYAWDTLERLGLRQKLISIHHDVGHEDSLAWWMSKEPLRTRPLGEGAGSTARELGLDVVAHETNHFLAYESITRAHTGDPNVLISRDGVSGEAAVHGNGFYTKVGRQGARGTGLTIRFHLDPGAREGTDFIRTHGGEFVVVQNKTALKVIPESLNIEPIEYFEMLVENKKISRGDRGILEKFKRKLSSKALALSGDQKAKLIQAIQRELSGKQPHVDAISEIFSMYPKLQTEVVSTVRGRLLELLTHEVDFHRPNLKVVDAVTNWEPGLLQMSPGLAEKLEERAVHLFENAQSKEVAGEELAVWMKFVRRQAPELIKRYLESKKFYQDYGSQNWGAMKTLIRRLPEEMLEEVYTSNEELLIKSPPKTERGAQEEAAQELINRMALLRPEKLRRLLRDGPLHFRKMAVSALFQVSPIPEWLRTELIQYLKSDQLNDRLIGMYRASRLQLSPEEDRIILNYLRSDQDRLAEGAMTYYDQMASNGISRADVQPEALRILSAWDKTRERLDGHYNSARTEANYFFNKQKNWNPVVLNTMISEINAASLETKSYYIHDYRNILVQAGKSDPKLLEQIEDISVLAQSKCLTQHCISVYLKKLKEPMPESTPSSSAVIRRQGELDQIARLPGPLPDSLIDAMGEYSFYPDLKSELRKEAAFHYAKLGGKNPRIAKQALHVISTEYFNQYRDPKSSMYKDKAELMHKLQSICMSASLKQLVE
jgi:hypothetical protein